MYDRPRTYTPEDRVLRWVALASPRFPKGIPTDRFVRQLRGELAPLTFMQLDSALRILEGHGLIQRDWDSPGEFRVRITDTGNQQAKLLEEPGPPPPPPPPPGPTSPPFVVPSSPPASAPPASYPPTVPPAGPVMVGPSPTAGFRAVPIAPVSRTAGPPFPVDGTPGGFPPASVVSPSVPTAAPQEPPAAPMLPVTSPSPSIPAAAPEPLLAGPVRGRSAGAIPSRGPPSSANVPVRVLLYCLLYGLAKGEEFPLVPGEDLARFLLNQGFMLSEEFLTGLLENLQRHDLLSFLPRPTGGYDLQLSPRGHRLCDGLISGHVPRPPPEAAATLGGSSPSPASDTLEDQWSDDLAASAQLKTENETLKAALEESERRRKEDRETLDEVLHQIEEQDTRMLELQETVARLSGAASSAGADPSSSGAPSRDAVPRDAAAADPQDPTAPTS